MPHVDSTEPSRFLISICCCMLTQEGTFVFVNLNVFCRKSAKKLIYRYFDTLRNAAATILTVESLSTQGFE